VTRTVVPNELTNENRYGAREEVCARDGAFQAAQLLDLLRRERSDFLSFKRRVEQERSTDRADERVALVSELLPLLDDLDRAFGQVPQALADDPWVRGVAFSRTRIEQRLRGWGVERVGRVGELFDPDLHEAVSYEEDPDMNEMLIQAVILPGYRMGRRLIRAARVAVVGPPRGAAHEAPEHGGL
jgi:molecular chaperone GrpE